MKSKFLHLRELSFRRKARRTIAKKNSRRKNKAYILNNTEEEVKKRKSVTPPERAIKLNVKNKLSLLKSPNNVISYIHLIDKQIKKYENQLCLFKLDMSLITDIDIGAISLILSKIHKISLNNKFRFFGIFPKNNEVKLKMLETGFAEYIISISGKKYKQSGNNHIIKLGKEIVEPEKIGKLIQSTIKELISEDITYPPIYGIAIEIAANSVEHANKNDYEKNWYFGVKIIEENNEKKAIFILSDMGNGILTTLNRKFMHKIAERLSNTNQNYRVLYSAFEKKYGSSTGDNNRNRGLPLILKRFEQEYISELKVITNNVFLDFENINNSKELKTELKGTFYHWTLTKENILKWKNS